MPSDKRWPAVKYCSWGMYNAWILLVMGGHAVMVPPAGLEANLANSLLYLFSGIPLTLTLVVCGLLHKKVQPLVIRGPLVPLMGVLAGVFTFLAIGGWGSSLGIGFFALACAGTGFCTAFVCLRIGHLYSNQGSGQIFFTTFASALLCYFVYFMCMAVQPALSQLVVAGLPVMATLLTFLRQESPVERKNDIVPISMLPRGFFARVMLFVLVFSLAVGVTRGMAASNIANQNTVENGNLSVFISLVVVGMLVTVFAIVTSMRHFDVSKLYYPIIVIAALGILLHPLLGDEFQAVQLIVVNAAYNLFTLSLWCVFSNIAGQTSLSAVRVFGLGRGASAFGTTFGQAIALALVAFAPLTVAQMNAMSIALAVVILVMSIFILDERTIGDALDKTFREEPSGAGADATEEALEESLAHICRQIVRKFQLTGRESEVLDLLARGRSASYISSELGISYNTAKGHVRNLYAKCGVHSRQELIDLIELIATPPAVR